MIASKYNICFTPAWWRSFSTPSVSVSVTALVLPFLVPSNLWDWVTPGAYLVLIGVLLCGAICLAKLKEPGYVICGCLNNQGEWTTTKTNGETQTWQLSKHSRVTGLAAYVHCTGVKVNGDVTEYKKWVFRGEVGERSFRRLCRIIVLTQAS